MCTSWLFKKVLQLLDWKIVHLIPPQSIPKAVVVVAPHTSNWDFVYGCLALFTLDQKTKFAIKKEVMFFPLGPILKWLGAIPIDRKKTQPKKAKMIEIMAKLFPQHDSLLLFITPEGTRSYVKHWKKGFYWMAMQAKVPIILGYLDYATKQLGFGACLYPTGDIDKDMQQIYAFYKDKVGKYPEKTR